MGETGRELCERVGRRLSYALLGANVVGAVLLFVYQDFLAPLERPRYCPSCGPASDVPGFAVFLVVACLGVGWWCRRQGNRALAWLAQDRPPSLEDRLAVLRLPWRIVRGAGVAWLVAAVVFGFASLPNGHSGAHVVTVAMSIVLAGLVCTALGYLVAERTFRPIFAVALGGEPPAQSTSLGIRSRLVLAWVLGSAVPLAGLALLPLAAQTADERRVINGAVVALALGGLAIGLLTTVIAATSVAGPLDDVRRALRRVEAGDLDVQVDVDDAGEVGLLQSGVNHMVAGLRERHRLQDLFGRHVGVEVAKRALELSSGLDSEQRDASALFVDLVGSTAMAEVLPPIDVLSTLNAFFGAVVRAVTAQGGWVNKFEGDGALCVFGAPAEQPDHAARALRAARDLDVELRTLAAAHPGLVAAIGVSSGTLVAGNVGAEMRYEYTVIGRPVNEAARLTDLAKSRPSRMLASAAAVQRSGQEQANWSSAGTIAIRGQTAPCEVFEPIATADIATG